jgi:hypothetical protein
MTAPVRTTIVYAMISAMAVWPAAGLLAAPLGWATAFRLMLWASLSGYALLLVRWSGCRLTAPLIPLILLLAAALWPGGDGAFFFMVLGVLVWIRSGICFDSTPLRAVIAETITIAGGGGIVAVVNPATTVTWTLSIWLFILIQCLYFFIVPTSCTARNKTPPEDPFERACRNARRILEG